VYDPVETLEWMIGETLAALASDEVLDPARPGARPRRKGKAARAAEELRLATLCEALWNVAGRPVPLEAFAARVRDHAARPQLRAA
jgi:hypothetical protein